MVRRQWGSKHFVLAHGLPEFDLSYLDEGATHKANEAIEAWKNAICETWHSSVLLSLILNHFDFKFSSVLLHIQAGAHDKLSWYLSLSNCFDFQLGAADYIAVAENYHTVFIFDIPVMSMRIRDKVLVKINSVGLSSIDNCLIFCKMRYFRLKNLFSYSVCMISQDITQI